MPTSTIPSAPEWIAITCELAGALQEHREAAGVSVHDVASWVGIAPESYAAWESPERQVEHVNPAMRRLARAADFLGLSLADLLDLELLRPEGSVVFAPVVVPQVMLDDERSVLGVGTIGTDGWWQAWCESFGLRIRARRFQLSLSLASAAESIERDRRAVADVEGARNPGLPLLLSVELARAMQCSLVDLLPITDD